MVIERKYNRVKTHASKPGRFFCWGCDCVLAWKGRKCPLCGHKDPSKRKKHDVLGNNKSGIFLD